MNVIRNTILALGLTAVVGGCALVGMDSGYRSLTIRNHEFEPRKVDVPAGQPFILTVDGFDDKDLAISAPELGINLIRIPATQEDSSPITQSRIIPGRSARLPLGPLKPGSYLVSCACHGEPSEAVIVAR
jgi:Cupredoxin-like domain